jgi:hypothetical protein
MCGCVCLTNVGVTQLAQRLNLSEVHAFIPRVVFALHPVVSAYNRVMFPRTYGTTNPTILTHYVHTHIFRTRYMHTYIRTYIRQTDRQTTKRRQTNRRQTNRQTDRGRERRREGERKGGREGGRKG